MGDGERLGYSPLCTGGHGEESEGAMQSDRMT